MKIIYLLLLLVAAGCFAVAAATRTDARPLLSRVNLIAAGLLAWVAVAAIRQLDLVID